MRNALNAIIAIGSPAVNQLSITLNDESAHFRWQAAWAMAKIKDADAVEPLIKALNDEVSNVSWMASVALGQIEDNRAIEPLISLLDNRDSGLRASAEFSLKKITGKNFRQNISEWNHWFKRQKFRHN
jgi:HEAT repeat protein